MEKKKIRDLAKGEGYLPPEAKEAFKENGIPF